MSREEFQALKKRVTEIETWIEDFLMMFRSALQETEEDESVSFSPDMDAFRDKSKDN